MSRSGMPWLVVGGWLIGSGFGHAAPGDPERVAPTPLETLRWQADSLMTLVETDVARRFLAATPDLPDITTPRVIYTHRETGEAFAEGDTLQRPPGTRAGYERRELDPGFYYFTRYGSPLAFVRALDVAAQHGLVIETGTLLLDFGFGSIGQLRLLASLGADVIGVEVDPVLEALYSGKGDTGVVARSAAAPPGPPGTLTLRFGRYPADRALVNAVGGGLDLFVSKNTLKRGYIHPAREVDPRLLVHLGVDDETYVRTVFDALLPGGLFLIYNLHPAESGPEDPYRPWADGRCPFDRALVEAIGFEVIAFDRDDTPVAREMGRRLGWKEVMDLESDLFGTYTLLRRPR